jgi:hypothetical protein
MYKFIIFFPIFVFFISCSKLDKKVDWKIYQQTEYITVFIDDNSIKKKDNYVSFWYFSRLPLWGETNFLWKMVYDCKKRKSMSLYFEVVPSIETLPKNVPDLTDEDRWVDITNDDWDSSFFEKHCGSLIKKFYF